MSLEVFLEFRVSSKINQTTFVREWIDYSEPSPLNDSILNIARHHQRKLSILLDVQGVKWTDKSLVRTSSDANANLTPRLFNGGVFRFKTTHNGKLVRRLENPGFVRIGHCREFTNGC